MDLGRLQVDATRRRLLVERLGAVAGGVRLLLCSRYGEPLPPSLADGLDGRGRAADNPRLVAHGLDSSQGWWQNKFEDV